MKNTHIFLNSKSKSKILLEQLLHSPSIWRSNPVRAIQLNPVELRTFSCFMQDSASCDFSSFTSFTSSFTDAPIVASNVATTMNQLDSQEPKINSLLNSHAHSLLAINCQSLLKNIDLLRLAVRKLPTQFICVNEIWSAQASSSLIDKYNEPIFRHRSTNSGYGGVGIYVQNGTDFSPNKTVNDLKLKIIEHISIDANIDNSSVTIVSIYRKPNTSIPQTIHDINDLLSCLTRLNHRFVIAGDMNIDLANDSSVKNQYLDTIDTFHCFQSVQTFSRITSNTATIIDHVISNFPLIKSCTSQQNVSDHLGVVSVWKSKIRKRSNRSENNDNQCTAKKVVDIEKTSENFNNIDWSIWHETHKDKNVDIRYDEFMKIINNNLVFKKKKSKKKVPELPWYSKQLLNEREAVVGLKKIFAKNRSIDNENAYKNAHRQYKQNMYLSKNHYFETKLKEAGTNSRLIWATINLGLQRSKKSAMYPSKMTHNGLEYNTKESIAELFSGFFKDSAYNLSKTITSNKNHLDFLNLVPSCKAKMKFQPTTEIKTLQLMKSLKPKSSSGYDYLSSKLVKKAAFNLCVPITSIINQSFAEQKVPDNLKVSKLQPIYKSDNSSLPQNWRPINQLSILSKLTEMTANEQIQSHFESNEIISNHQFGFRKGNSCLHPLFLTRHFLEMSKNQNQYSILISIDLKSAFDMLDSTNILLDKYRHYGLDSSSINWLKSFFSDRRHFVSWQNTNSEMKNLHNLSVVQGSNLGPAAFNAFINDIQSISKFCCIQYADDSQLLLSNKNLNQLISDANHELKTILDFMESNKLLVSKSKTNYMIIPPRPRETVPNTVIKLGSETIKQVTESKFLGLAWDDRLKFSTQISNVKKKLKSAIGALLMVKKSFNYRSKMAIYNGLFQSHIDYAFLIWGDKLSKKQLIEFTTLQKKALRIIFNARFNSHTNLMFALSGITPIENLYQKNALLFMKKAQLGKQPKVFRDILEFSSDSRLRSNSANKAHISRHLKNGNLVYNLYREWNNCHSQFRNSRNEHHLKKLLKNDFIEKSAKNTCKKRQCYMCIADRNLDLKSYMIK